MIQPLTKPTSKNVIFKWTSTEQEAFDKIKWMVSIDKLLSLTEFNKLFDIYTDAREHQINAIIIQERKKSHLIVKNLQVIRLGTL